MVNVKMCPFIILLFVFILGARGDDFKEELFIKPLLPNNVYVYFQFITIVDTDSSSKYEFLSYKSFLTFLIIFLHPFFFQRSISTCRQNP